MPKFERRPNRIEVRGEETVVFIRVKGEEIECLIDTADLELVRDYTWCLTSWGYAQSTKLPDKPQVLMHVLIMNPPQGMVVDHIHHRTLDNRRSQMRVVTEQQNCHNRCRHNSGVAWVSNAQMWRVRFMINRKTIGFGCYRKREEADEAANRIREKIRRGESVEEEHANRPMTRKPPTRR